MKWYGYRGKVIEIDLSSADNEPRELSRDEAFDYVGGAGLNAKILYDLTEPDTDPLSPENPLIFGAGPLAGTSFPASARATVTALSPLTGIFGDANGGSFFAARLKMAGYDNIVLKGKAEYPSYLYLDQDGPQIMDAGDLWGADTLTCDEVLSDRHRGSTVVCIGPAGENLVKYACIQGNRNSCSFSRSGMGAVMGSKNLKAIVVAGRGKVPVHDADGLSRLSRSINDSVEDSTICKYFHAWGTPVAGYIYSIARIISEYNGRRTARIRKALKLGPHAFNRLCDWEPRGCWKCPLRCHKHYTIKSGRYKGETGMKHEVGYISPIGLNLGIDDLGSMLHLINASDRLGIDCREFAGTLGMVIDCLEHGILDPREVGASVPAWGDVDAVEKMMNMAALRQGFGDILAEGTRRAAGHIGGGAKTYALNTKGMFMENFNSPAMMCAFAVATRGGDHLKGSPFLTTTPLLLNKLKGYFDGTLMSMIPFVQRDTGRVVWWHENYKTMIDSLGVCFFLALTLGLAGDLLPPHLAEAYHLATGLEAGEDELLEAGERAYMLERVIDAHRGIAAADDSFIKRPERRSAGRRLDLEHPGMLPEYYRYRGLDADGQPKPEVLERLGLEPGLSRDRKVPAPAGTKR